MSNSSQPYPQRFWWLKRLSIAAAVLLLAAGGLRAYWGHAMHRQLEATLAEIRATGEPIDFEDMRRDPVPDADNAARYYRDAFDDWPRVEDPTTGTRRLIIETEWHSKPDQHEDPIEDDAAYLDELAPALALLRQAGAAPDADWDVQLDSPAFDILLPHLGESRDYARLMDDAAQRAHEAGQHDLALKLIEHMFHLSDAVEAPPQTLIGRLVGISIRAMALSRLERLTPTLEIGSASGAATPERVDRLINRLLDEDHWRQGFYATHVGERWYIHDTTMAIYDGRASWSSMVGRQYGPLDDVAWLRNLFIGPMLIAEIDTMLRWDSTRLAAIEVVETKPQYTAFMAANTTFNPDDSALQSWRHPLLSMLMPGVESAVDAEFRTRANQVMAATALALRRFELDHGQRPTTLEELVPGELPHVPRDPWAETDEPIGYRPDGASARVAPSDRGPDPVDESDLPRPAILYSVGPNHEDRGGVLTFDGDGKLQERYRYDNQGDHFFLLDPWPEPVREPTPRPRSPSNRPGP